jgi:hypothetical protein
MVVVLHQCMQPPVALLVHLLLAGLPAQRVSVCEDATCTISSGTSSRSSQAQAGCADTLLAAQQQAVK